MGMYSYFRFVTGARRNDVRVYPHRLPRRGWFDRSDLLEHAAKTHAASSRPAELLAAVRAALDGLAVVGAGVLNPSLQALVAGYADEPYLTLGELGRHMNGCKLYAYVMAKQARGFQDLARRALEWVPTTANEPAPALAEDDNATDEEQARAALAPTLAMYKRQGREVPSWLLDSCLDRPLYEAEQQGPVRLCFEYDEDQFIYYEFTEPGQPGADRVQHAIADMLDATDQWLSDKIALDNPDLWRAHDASLTTRKRKRGDDADNDDTDAKDPKQARLDDDEPGAENATMEPDGEGGEQGGEDTRDSKTDDAQSTSAAEEEEEEEDEGARELRDSVRWTLNRMLPTQRFAWRQIEFCPEKMSSW